jgi:hypothetical protein
MAKQTNQPIGITFLSLLTLLFIGLKLTGQIDWSWWLILAPMWVPVALAFSIILGMAIYVSLNQKGK